MLNLFGSRRLCHLTLHRIKKKNDVNHDKWIGVGGKLDPGETAEACALREVWEETGLTMQSPAYRGIVDFTCEPWPAERMNHVHLHPFFTGTLAEAVTRAHWNGCPNPK
ncbi:MAG: NUDIX domain-containing protein [Subdoligranulum sp.]